MSTFRELLQDAENFLEQHRIADANVDAWYLLADVFGLSRADYFLHQEDTACEEDIRRYMKLIKLRSQHMPLQLIMGTQEFMGMEFIVTQDVLIPRQDTEILVEEALKQCSKKSVLDLCTGSGCILISLVKLGNVKEAVGSDISDKALEVAERNVKKHEVEVSLIKSDLFNNIDGTFDIIVSNPPYIPSAEINDLMPEVRDYEPELALDGDFDGLKYYRRIAAELNKHLNKNGFILFEIGYNQGIDVSRILQKEGIRDIQIKKDLSGLDRVISGRRY